MTLKEEFVTGEEKKYRFQIGKKIAASLPGFIAGAVAASIILVPVLIWIARFCK